jgi:hypothetical protein
VGGGRDVNLAVDTARRVTGSGGLHRHREARCGAFRSAPSAFQGAPNSRLRGRLRASQRHREWVRHEVRDDSAESSGSAIRSGASMRGHAHLCDIAVTERSRGTVCAGRDAVALLQRRGPEQHQRPVEDLAQRVINNRAIGWGANPASRGTPGGGSGGAIYLVASDGVQLDHPAGMTFGARCLTDSCTVRGCRRPRTSSGVDPARVRL